MDLVDITHQWFLERYPNLFYEIVSNGGCTDGKIVIVSRKNPKTEDHDDNHILSLSVKGSCWHTTLRTRKPHFTLKLSPADRSFFDTLDWLVKRALHENR